MLSCELIAVITVEPTVKRYYLRSARKRGFRVKGKYLIKESYGLLKRKDSPVSKHSYLCSEHLSEDCFMRCVGGKRYLKSGSVPTRFSFSPEEKPKRKAPVYRSAARETTKSQVKDKVILNSQSNPVDNL